MAEKILFTVADGVFIFMLIAALVGYIEAEWPTDLVEWFRNIKEILGR